jgi:CysZ protein
MKAINYHIRGILASIEQLLKGKYLIYFVPGLILTGLFLYSQSVTVDLDESIDLTSDYWMFSWIGGVADTGVSWFFGAIEWIMEQLYVFVVITVLSPFFTALGEKYDRELTGKITEGGFVRFMNDMIRMIFVVILSLLLEIICLVIYWIFSKIFGFSDMVDTIVGFCIASFFFGFAFYDFALERYEKGVFSSLGFAFSAPLGMIIIGAIFKGVYAIPYIGIPLAPVLAVMISTVTYAYYIKQLPKSKQLSNE